MGKYDGIAIRARFPKGPADLSHELPAAPGQGFRLTEAQRKAMSTRLMLQAPTGIEAKLRLSIARDLDSRIAGLPTGAFMALDALRLLADQGNRVARDLFDHESERLGLTRPFSIYRRN